VLLFPSGSFAREPGECLAGPNKLSPQGSHWYYRVDRVNRRKCWYLGPLGRRTTPSASQIAQERRPVRPTVAPTATAPVRPAVAPTAIAPVAPMHPIVRQMESERFAVTTVGEGPGAGFPAQPDQGKAAETDLTPVLSSEPDPGTPIGNAEDETPSVWPVVAKT